MRTFLKILSATLLLATFVFANDSNANIEKINKNFLNDLKHENPGVVESAIKIVVFMKIKHPDADYGDIIDQLNDLTLEGTSNIIRLKAFIASDFLTNYNQYKWLKDVKYDNSNHLFDAYLLRMSLTGITKN